MTPQQCICGWGCTGSDISLPANLLWAFPCPDRPRPRSSHPGAEQRRQRLSSCPFLWPQLGPTGEVSDNLPGGQSRETGTLSAPRSWALHSGQGCSALHFLAPCSMDCLKLAAGPSPGLSMRPAAALICLLLESKPPCLSHHQGGTSVTKTNSVTHSKSSEKDLDSLSFSIIPPSQFPVPLSHSHGSPRPVYSCFQVLFILLHSPPVPLQL